MAAMLSMGSNYSLRARSTWGSNAFHRLHQAKPRHCAVRTCKPASLLPTSA